ncbi:MAG: hypothetical protein CL850_03685 [Crocinitomicaceae bacterium]|nr:hypothetical protein [Crocinitomicaceae bacterium]
MLVNIGKHINELNHKLGIIFFNNDNLFTYNLYNFYSDFKKSKRSKKTDWVNNFHNKGYVELCKIPEKDVFDLSKEIEMQQPKDNDMHRYDFQITNTIKELIDRIIKKNISPYFDILEKYYNSSLYISNCNLRRTYGFTKIENSPKEFYAENWHCDTYINNFFKIFINISDIKDIDGPTNILSKKETKKFVRANNYLNRKSYNQNSNDDIFFNVGKRGKVLICNTTQCLHRAGIPEEGSFRDLLIISVLAIPQLKQDIMYLGNKYPELVWSNEKKNLSTLAKKYSKPVGVINLIKKFKNC